MAKVIGIDVDGLLAKGESWTPEECLKAKPNPKAVEEIKKLHLTGFIVIYTARRDSLIPATLRWLKANDIPFHAISNNKTPFDELYDDRAINIRQWLSGKPKKKNT